MTDCSTSYCRFNSKKTDRNRSSEQANGKFLQQLFVFLNTGIFILILPGAGNPGKKKIENYDHAP
jgi:hypothetical protein